MSDPSPFEKEIALPDEKLLAREATLLGFASRYARVRDQLRLLLDAGDLQAWNKKHHKGKLALIDLVAEQYPLVVFHGDVGTGKTAMAECIANRLVAEARVEDSILFKLSNRVRGAGMVGEMGTALADAFQRVAQSAGKHRRAILIIDEGDSLGASRTQEHSHHEDKVAVNTLIQGIDGLRDHGGRVVVFLCTNRLSVLDAAIRRRAAIVEEFQRPSDAERRALFEMDLAGLAVSPKQFDTLVALTGAHGDDPVWTYSDLRTRLYPTALASAYPDHALTFDHLEQAAKSLKASPVMEDR
jgi:AAA+ superfamily predicted ATPase